jgi:hypothetical protein
MAAFAQLGLGQDAHDFLVGFVLHSEDGVLMLVEDVDDVEQLLGGEGGLGLEHGGQGGEEVGMNAVGWRRRFIFWVERGAHVLVTFVGV